MKLRIIILSAIVLLSNFAFAQETELSKSEQEKINKEEVKKAIEEAKKESELVIEKETKRLKEEVERIDKELIEGSITKEEALKMKKDIATEVSKAINEASEEIENSVNELLIEQEKEFTKSENLNKEIEEGKYDDDDDFYGVRITEDDNDIVISFKNKDYNDYNYKKHKKRTRFKFDIDFGLSGLQENYDVADPTVAYPEFELWQSMYFGFSFNAKTRLFNENSPLHLKYGLGLQWSNFSAKGDYLLEKNNGQPEYVLDPIGRNFSDSRLRNLYMTLPVMLQLDFSKYKMDNSWKLGIGAYGGVRWYTWQKVSFRDNDGDRTVNTTRNAYYMNPFSYGLQAEIGYGVFSILAKYELSQLFEVSNPYDYQMWNLGVKFAL